MDKITWLEHEVERKEEVIRNSYKKFGRVLQHYAPFTKDFPVPKDKFIFIGTPIDGIAFCEDKIVFLEIKTRNSFLSKNQQRVKKLIEEGKVEFREVRF